MDMVDRDTVDTCRPSILYGQREYKKAIRETKISLILVLISFLLDRLRLRVVAGISQMLCLYFFIAAHVGAHDVCLVTSVFNLGLPWFYIPAVSLLSSDCGVLL